MWFIQRKSDGKTIWLLNKEYTIGRRNCSIELSDDLSVSRQHLKLSIDYSPLLQNSGPPTLQIMDLGSTFGIFVKLSTTNTDKIEPGKWVGLNVDSSFHFGAQNDWSVKWKNISVLCSALGSVERKKLNKELGMLGAKVLSDWQNDITHLVTDKIMLTQKVLDSLLAVKPIVMVEFFEKWVKILERDPCGSIPDASQFTPVIGSALGQFEKQCFLPKEERKSLFLGKTFIFATPNELKSSMAIAATKAGGIISNNFEAFNTNGSLLMESASPSLDYNRLLTNLSFRGERSIPQNEIGLAILSCSVEMYCNPCARNLTVHSQTNNKLALASVQCSLRDQETQMGNVLQVKNEEPPIKRNRIESSEIPQVLEPPTKKIHLEANTVVTLKMQHCDEEDYKNSLKGKKVVESLRYERSYSDTETHGVDKMEKCGLMVFQQDFSSESSSTSHFKSVTSSFAMKEQIQHVDGISNGFINNQHRSILDTVSQNSSESISLSTSTCQFKFCGAKRKKSSSYTASNDSKKSMWDSDVTGKLNTSKLIVKNNLIRPEGLDKGLVSQKLQIQLKESHVIARIKSMNIICLKDGKWIMKT